MMRNKNWASVFLVTIVVFTIPIKIVSLNCSRLTFCCNESRNSGISISNLYADENKVSLKSDSGKNDGKSGGNTGQSSRSMLIKVMAVVLIVWAGLAAYLFRIDRKISRLEKDINEL